MVFIIQMLISIRIKMKQGLLIAVAVMNVIVLFCLPIIRTMYDNDIVLNTTLHLKTWTNHFNTANWSYTPVYYCCWYRITLCYSQIEMLVNSFTVHYILHHYFNKMVGFHVFYWIIHGIKFVAQFVVSPWGDS